MRKHFLEGALGSARVCRILAETALLLAMLLASSWLVRR